MVSYGVKIMKYEEKELNPLANVVMEASEYSPNQLIFKDDQFGVWLYHADALEFMDLIIKSCPQGKFDMIFADPPYFLSNGGITCHAGKMVKVDKGEWDKSRGSELNHEFNLAWLSRCQKVLKPNGTMWITGTHHVIFSVGFAPNGTEISPGRRKTSV